LTRYIHAAYHACVRKESVMKTCPIHGPHENLCPKCLMDLGSAMNPWVSGIFTTPIPTFTDPIQQNCDRDEVEVFIKSLDGIR